MRNDDPDLLYGIKAIAAALGISPRQAAHQIEAQRIPTFKFGKTVCARRSGLRRLLAECEAKAREARS